MRYETPEILQMKTDKRKIFDSVKMVREIRDAFYKMQTEPHFDRKELDQIKAKWSKLLALQEKQAHAV